MGRKPKRPKPRARALISLDWAKTKKAERAAEPRRRDDNCGAAEMETRRRRVIETFPISVDWCVYWCISVNISALSSCQLAITDHESRFTHSRLCNLGSLIESFKVGTGITDSLIHDCAYSVI
ncbi:hypothetical protein E3N88_25728 [Mikania micrantha]|uniref:Uncharacterized protein n=1 Tax=Mikania micrantha TaxID=192012 RepID=A0A5N6N5K4_9ASTR|nr:hypothetical protein E3N88_43655 [Mikania micrantha]KAD4385559.1 hypothetical protein E3N88_25728 [Mikania micrantha]